ncbi:MAG: phage portal protein [Candidatus Limiplasma sp.]|nr:phage portal protein [Candidatus Limiplasma sp.]
MIESYLKRNGYALAGRGRPKEIPVWEQWYKGFVPEFHRYWVQCGEGRRIQAERFRAGMAKVICQDFGSLLVNEHVQVTSDALGDDLTRVLQKNKFHTRMNRLAELTMALGTGAVVVYKGADGEPVIDYIGARMIYPLRWDNENVTECAFASPCIIGQGREAKEGLYIQAHVKQGDAWVVRNALLNSAGKEEPLPDGVLEESPPSPVPLFYLVRPNSVNTAEPQSPMGASVFADAIDQLKATDIVYDSYINEFVLGKKRLLVPLSLATMIGNKDGTLEPIFDPNDALFYTYADGTESDAKRLTEVDMHLRIAEHDQGMQTQINFLSKKCGLGMNRYKFDAGVIQTAKEVISSQSDLYQSLKRHEKTFGDAIIGLVKAIGFLLGRDLEAVDASVAFDDSIIEDTDATSNRVIRLVGAGLMSKKRALMELYKLDEQEAEKRMDEILRESRMNQEAVENAMYNADASGDL